MIFLLFFVFSQAYLHARSIVHRDLKPDNIGLVKELSSVCTLSSTRKAKRENLLKILDLGEARAMRPQSGDVELTSPRLRGTPLYQASVPLLSLWCPFVVSLVSL